MTGFQIIAVLITLAALFGYLNFRFFHLPMTLGVMAISLVVSLSLIAVGHFHPEIERAAQAWLEKVEFDEVLMQGMLSFLLFAGALQINVNELADQKGVIGVLALGGVMLSTLFFGTAVFLGIQSRGLLLGESTAPEVVDTIHRLAQREPTVDQVRRPLTMHFGPDNVLLAMEIQFKPRLSTAELMAAIDQVEARIREAFPQIKQIYIEVESLKEGQPRTEDTHEPRRAA